MHATILSNGAWDHLYFVWTAQTCYFDEACFQIGAWREIAHGTDAIDWAFPPTVESFQWYEVYVSEGGKDKVAVEFMCYFVANF